MTHKTDSAQVNNSFRRRLQHLPLHRIAVFKVNL
jgi:hypothetical protein